MPNSSLPSHLADSVPAPAPHSAERHEGSGRTEPWWPDWLRLRDLIEGSRIPEARALAPELAEKWPESGTLQHYARCLEPPVARVAPGTSGRDPGPNLQWLRDHAGEHSGMWVAILDGGLLAVGPDRQEVVSGAERAHPGAQFLVVRMRPKGSSNCPSS